MFRISRLAMPIFVACGVGMTGLGFGAGIAQADNYTWCPGDDVGGYGGGFNTPADGRPNWDWNVCHTYSYVNYGQGNVSPTVWEGDNPPPPYWWQPPNMCWDLFIPRAC